MMTDILHNRLTRLAGSMLLAAALAGPAAAADEDRAWQLGIAIGAGQRSNPLLNADAIDINAVIDFSWYGERFFFDNGDLGYLLFEDNRFAINWVATYNNERNYYNYLTGDDLGLNIFESLGDDFRFTSIAEDAAADSSLILIDDEGDVVNLLPGIAHDMDTTLVSALADTELAGRSSAINSGLEFLYLSPLGDFQAQVLTDVSGTHNGQEAWLSWTKPWYFATPAGRIDEVALTVGLEWKSADLVGYYYGVTPAESFPGRPVYRGHSGTNGYIRLSARHAFSDHWQAVSMVEREFLSDAITDSPVVVDDAVNTFFVGLFYRF